MFKNASQKTKGEQSRAHVLDAALKLFRRRGFERTTMRAIASEAGLSLGAAYHYFPSKDALVLAYYEWMQAEHERVAAPSLRSGTDLDAKISNLLLTKLDLLRRDRKLLAVLFGNLGDASNPLSVFSPHTVAIRERSVAQFVSIFEDPTIPDEMRVLLGRSLWLAHLAVFLFFIHDSSPNQTRTRRLVDHLVELFANSVPVLLHPLAGPIRARLLRLMEDIDSPTGVVS